MPRAAPSFSQAAHFSADPAVANTCAEYRPAEAGQSSAPLGPYFKHQVWQGGHNLSRRVPTEQAPALAEAIANRQTFEKLASDYVGLTVEHTRQGDAKKNSKSKLRPKLKKPSKA